tara:strand:- start:41 stop:463 length:423 start_codon:yes stop_codon:yes gene_type:complete
MKVFTNGCFDILHRGHLELLEYCNKLACPSGNCIIPPCWVVVGLNSDDSIRRIKGQDRPINNQKDRFYFLKSLKFVDEVIIFEEDSPVRLIREVNPDLIVKGSSSVIDKEETAGYKLKIFNQVGEYSTTNIINEISSNRR